MSSGRRLDSLNFHLLCTLGLSHDSAEIVIDRINELKAEVAAKDAEIDKCAEALAKTLAWIDEAKPLLEKGGEAERALTEMRANFIEADHHRCVLRTAAEKLCEAWHDEHAQSSTIEPLVDTLDSAVRMAPNDNPVRAMLADPVALRANILRHGPPGFDLYSAEHIERIKTEAVREAVGG